MRFHELPAEREDANHTIGIDENEVSESVNHSSVKFINKKTLISIILLILLTFVVFYLIPSKQAVKDLVSEPEDEYEIGSEKGHVYGAVESRNSLSFDSEKYQELVNIYFYAAISPTI